MLGVRSRRVMMIVLVASAAASAACHRIATNPCPMPAWPTADARLVDLSHAYDRDTIYWPTETGFTYSQRAAGYTDQGYWYEAGSFCSPEHGGTHIDAPIHFAADRDTLDKVPVERLIGPAALIDVSKQAAADPDYQVRTEDFLAWEALHGPLPSGAIVLLRTGYGQFWPDRVRYMGTDERGEAAVAKLHFPGLSPEAASWLVSERSVHAIGLDTPSIDYGQSTTFLSHRTLFAQDIPAFENLARLDELPAACFWVVALPMKIRGGSGGPLRAVAIVPTPE